MTAFEKTWQLLKMPIMPDTMRYDGKRNQWDAKFYDPESDETLPMQAKFYEGTSADKKFHWTDNAALEGSIMGPNPDDRQRTHAYAEIDEPLGGGEPPYPLEYRMKDAWTKKPYQRRGYAKALYDLMAYALANQEDEPDLMPDTMQSQEAHDMWQKYAQGGPWPHDGAWGGY
jgi:hypothetical protein